jgi:hypothetical protein
MIARGAPLAALGCPSGAQMKPAGSGDTSASSAALKGSSERRIVVWVRNALHQLFD